MKAQEFQIEDFTYHLPEDKIAKYPLEERDLSKLLVYREGEIIEDKYRNVVDYLPENSLLIFNDTKVVQARMLFKNSNGAKIEIFCLEPADEFIEPIRAMTTTKTVRWKCLVGRIAKWKEQILFSDDKTLEAEIITRNDGDCIIEFRWSPEDKTFAEVLEGLGEIPIPPYLKRESESLDTNRYQTVYANQKGSVAAPTAGLHFTSKILESFNSRSIKNDFVTLHVGAGTFKQVKSKTLEGHEMHAEWIDVKIETIQNILDCVKSVESQVIAVGTTSLRTIESLYWMGVKSFLSPDCQLLDLEIKQWNPYELPGDISTENALTALVEWMKKNALKTLVSKTQLLIVPNYELRVADALITNFHQPNSTLLLIVAAVTGEDWKEIYKYALENEFRFLSYGDGSLLFKNKNK